MDQARKSVSRRRIATFLSASAVLAAGRTSMAVDYTWDPDTTTGVQGGSGTWNTTTATWTTNGGTSNVAYANGSSTNRAIFEGGDGTYAITVGASIGALLTVFNSSGYTLSATSPRSISTDGGISLASGVTAAIGNNVTFARQGQTGIAGGGGTLTLQSGGAFEVQAVTFTANLNVRNVTVVVDGGTLRHNSTAATGNILLSGTASDVTTLTVNTGLVSTAQVASGLVLGVASTTSTVNLNGGTIQVGRVSGAGTSTFYFNGGTLKPITGTSNGATFMTGLSNASVKNGGAKIDTNGVDITIAQSLLRFAGATTDGLIKSGAGRLTLTGANTFGGMTSVAAGTLATGTTGTVGAGHVSVDAGATLTLGNAFSISDGATLTFTDTSVINLNATGGTEWVKSLFDASTNKTLNTFGVYTAAQLNSYFGNSVFSSASGETMTVPEPASLGMLGLAVQSLLLRRRSRSRRMKVASAWRGNSLNVSVE